MITLISICSKSTAEGIDINQLWLDCGLKEVVSFEIFNTAITGHNKIENLHKKNLVTIIDFSKQSTERRFYIIDIEKKQAYHR